MKSRPWLLEAQAGGNAADSAGVTSFLLLVGYFVVMGSFILPMLRQINWIGEKGDDNIVAVATSPLPTGFQEPGFVGVRPVQAAPVESPTPGAPTPTQTAMPTYTPYPTYTPFMSPTPEYARGVFLYSYYNPALGGVNCSQWDEETQTCVSTMASGKDWRQWYGKALACPSVYPMYTVFRVTSPESIAGDYVCLDRGGSLEGTNYLDFLDTQQRLEWNASVEALIIYPGGN